MSLRLAPDFLFFFGELSGPVVLGSPKRERVMADQSEQQRRYKEFLDLLPLTISLAGLPNSEPGRYFTAEQIESRLFTMRHAYDSARQLARDSVQRS